jgi:hypothetical protein
MHYGHCIQITRDVLEIAKSHTFFQMFATFPTHNDTKNNLKDVCMMQWTPKLS